jgi:glycosyltransferase involved in cell wall biosynthesis
MRFSILLPTRNRSENLTRFIDSVLDTCSDPKLMEFAIKLDYDDTTSFPIINKYEEKYPGSFRVLTSARANSMGKVWNDCTKIATGELIMMGSDDFIYRTKGWDAVIRDLFTKSKDKILYVFGEDGIQHGRIGTHGVIHRKWLDIAGYYVPEELITHCHDLWLDFISMRIGRKIYVPSLVFEHCHYSAGKAPMDDVYKWLAEREGLDRDLWNQTTTKRNDIIDKLMVSLEN